MRWSRAIASAAVALMVPLTAAQGGCSPPSQHAAGRSGPTVIYVQSKASSAWPVQRAVSVWNSGLRRVRLRYGRCPAGQICIRVTEADLGRVSRGHGGKFGETFRVPADGPVEPQRSVRIRARSAADHLS